MTYSKICSDPQLLANRKYDPVAQAVYTYSGKGEKDDIFISYDEPSVFLNKVKQLAKSGTFILDPLVIAQYECLF